MRNMLKTAAAAGLLAAAMSMTAFAGEWRQDQIGWWYQKDDGSYCRDGWSWVNGMCYYFTPEGYCLMNTTTPDGYTVDASGAWTVDGVVQTQNAADAGADVQDGGADLAVVDQGGTEVAVDGMTFIIPSGFMKDEAASAEDSIYFTDGAGTIAVFSEYIPEAEQYGALLESISEPILDVAMNEIGTPTAKAAMQFPTGTWYCYQYDAASVAGMEGYMYAYARISNARVQIVMFIGDFTSMTPNDVMANCLR